MAVSSVKDIIADVSAELGVPKVRAEEITKTVLNTIVQHVKSSGGFCYKGQFTISKSERKARTGKIVRKDPNTGEKKELKYSSPASTTLKITIGSDLKKELNKDL